MAGIWSEVKRVVVEMAWAAMWYADLAGPGSSGAEWDGWGGVRMGWERDGNGMGTGW